MTHITLLPSELMLVICEHLIGEYTIGGADFGSGHTTSWRTIS